MASTRPPAKVTPKATPNPSPSPAPKPSNTPSRVTANPAVTAAAAQSKAAAAQSKAAAEKRTATSATVTSAKTAKPASKSETKPTVTPSARGAATQAAFKAAEQLAKAKGTYGNVPNRITSAALQQAQKNFNATQNKINSIKSEAARDQQRAKENQARQQPGKTQKPSGSGGGGGGGGGGGTRRTPPKNPGVLVIRNPENPTTSTDPGGGTPTVDEEPTPETENIGAFSYSPPPSPPKQTLVPARDVVNFQSVPASVEAMEQVLFQQLSSFELVNMARRDTVEGLNPYYSVISNLSSIRKEYDPSQIIALQKPNQTLFDIYQINLYEKIPNDEYLLRNNISNFYYVDTNGDLIIELDNLLSDEIIEIEIATSGKIT